MVGIGEDREGFRGILSRLGLGQAVSVTTLKDERARAYRVETTMSKTLTVKVLSEDAFSSAGREAFAIRLAGRHGVPCPEVLAFETDAASGRGLMVMRYIEGQALRDVAAHRPWHDCAIAAGVALRQFHAIGMDRYGAFDAHGTITGADSHERFKRDFFDGGLTRFVDQGASPALAQRLRQRLEVDFDVVVPFSAGPVLVHDDIHPGNLIVSDDAVPRFLAVIDFGNARADDAISDLTKAIFCSEHDLPGMGALLRRGYGAIDHPDPERALAYYTAIHRITMWATLRRLGYLAHPEAPNDLLAPLEAWAEG